MTRDQQHYRVYLAGSVDDDWRSEFVKAYEDSNCQVPLAFIDPSQVELSLDANGILHQSVLTDISLVISSDLLIAYYSPGHIPIGTSCELFIAFNQGIPTITLIDHRLQQLINHPWIRTLSQFIILTNKTQFNEAWVFINDIVSKVFAL